MWAGALNNIPTGWGLCNGSLYGTIQSPDLTSRFVVGAGQSVTNYPYVTQYNVGDYGGEEFHQLSLSEIPSHNHNIFSGQGRSNSDYYGNGVAVGSYTSYNTNNPLTTNLNWALQGGDLNNEDPNTGYPNTLPHNNMPPYYALAYIIKYI
jgi:microcystin-dependent protein